MFTSPNSPPVTTTEAGELSPECRPIITTAHLAPAGEADMFETNLVTFTHSIEWIDKTVNKILAGQDNPGSSTALAPATDPPVVAMDYSPPTSNRVPEIIYVDSSNSKPSPHGARQ